MADFFQNGVITTMQNLKDRSAEELDADIETYAQKRKVALLLPALYSEFERPAMYKIIDELKHVQCLETIVLSLDQANKQQFLEVKKIMSVLPQEVKIVWNHGERIQSLYDELLKEGFPLNIPGKGRVVWVALGYILASGRHYAIALHDCDIVNYSRGLVERLIYPIVHRGLNFEFSKGFYARFTDKLYGRVNRLFYCPLVQALHILTGSNHFLKYLGSFRYALSGEFAIIRDLARGIRISPNWGLEVSLLSEVYHNSSTNRICEVEVMETYEHKHNPLSIDKPTEGLVRMATDIAKTLFRILSHDGVVMSEAFFRTLISTYFQEARNAIEAYNGLSIFNSLKYDRHEEIRALDAFIKAINIARDEFIDNPVGIRLISAWERIDSGLPLFSNKLSEYVEMDNE